MVCEPRQPRVHGQAPSHHRSDRAIDALGAASRPRCILTHSTSAAEPRVTLRQHPLHFFRLRAAEASAAQDDIVGSKACRSCVDVGGSFAPVIV
jgi:hypothetical protein